MTTFSQRLKLLRKEEKLTQQNLADILGIKRATIAKWESKNAIPDTVTLQKISEHFKTNIDYLLGNTERKYYEEESVLDNELYFSLTVQNFLHFKEVAINEGLTPELITKLIHSFQLLELEEKLLFESIDLSPTINTNLAPNESNHTILD